MFDNVLTLSALYNITLATTAVAGNALGIFEDLGDIYDQADMNLFFSTLTYVPIQRGPKK